MKKSTVLAFLIFVLFAVTNAQPQAINWREIPGFMESYHQMLDLNRNRFKDMNKIQIGDTVLLRSRSGSGIEGWVADKPVVNNGKNDCMWLINQRYLLNQLTTLPVDTIKIIKAEVVPPAEKTTKQVPKIISWIFLFIVLCLVAWFLYYMFKNVFKKPEVVSPDENPVITGGLSDDPAVALQQINAAYPNEPRAISAQKVMILAPAGVTSANVQMTFSNGVHTSTIRTGEIYTRVEREGGIIHFYRQHCGNLVGEVANGKFNLPVGWTWSLIRNSYVPTDAEAAAAAAEISQALELEKEKNVVNAPKHVTLSISEVSSDDIVKIINALKGSELNLDRLKYGDLKIKFLTIKKKG